MGYLQMRRDISSREVHPHHSVRERKALHQHTDRDPLHNPFTQKTTSDIEPRRQARRASHRLRNPARLPWCGPRRTDLGSPAVAGLIAHVKKHTCIGVVKGYLRGAVHGRYIKAFEEYLRCLRSIAVGVKRRLRQQNLSPIPQTSERATEV